MNATLPLRSVMYGARDPANAITQALGGVLERFELYGLHGIELNRLRARHFPHVPELRCNTSSACAAAVGLLAWRLAGSSKNRRLIEPGSRAKRAWTAGRPQRVSS